MNEIERFLTWFNGYVEEALRKNERRLVILSGTEIWALSLLNTIDYISPLLSEETKSTTIVNTINSTNKSCLIYGDSPYITSNVQKKRFHDHLGSESNVIIFSDSDFTIDAFAALSGTLKAGGILFLVMPMLHKNSQQSLFFKRFCSLVKKMPSHTIITESQTISFSHGIDSDRHSGFNENKKYSMGCVTKEQSVAVEAIGKVLSGHRKRPLVLTADRGRGKSSALAIACAQQMKEHQHNEFSIVITAPDIQSLSVFYRQLSNSLAQALDEGSPKDLVTRKKQEKTVVHGKATLTFMPVDQLIKHPIKCNLLLVDEAAAVPVYLLEQLLSHYHRMVFSSTVHGYEGAGRSFTLKFQKILDKVCPQWTNLHINEPIRWRKNDPLEQLVFEACLLNAELPMVTESLAPLIHINDNIFDHKTNDLPKFQLKFEVITALELVANEVLLKQIFAVLVTAHYQTKPSDLQLMLDNPQVQVACLFSINNDQSEVVAVALLMNEGESFGVNNEEIIEVKNSKRRLRNQFLPQSLLSHCGFEDAFNYRYMRIMRIAVHPKLQQQGIGSSFIQEIELLAKEQGADFIGSSFGANHELLAFWLNAKFSTTRIGFTKDKASGEHSALVIKGLNLRGKEKQKVFRINFYRSFDYLLLDEYKLLAPELIYLLLKSQPKSDLLHMSELDLANVRAYSTGERLFSSCVYSLYLWFKQDLLNVKTQSNNELEFLLISRLMQKHDSDTVCRKYGYTGKKMLNKAIKDYVSLRLKIS